MNAEDVRIGADYLAKVRGHLDTVRITGVHPGGGWWGMDRNTRRLVRIGKSKKLLERLPQGG